VVGYGYFFSNRYVVIQLFSLIVAQCGVTYITPTLSVHLNQMYGMPIALTGLAFAMTALAGGISAPFMGKLCAKIGRPAVTTLGFSIEWVAINFSGPTRWLHLPNELWSSLIGLTLLGVGVAAVQVSSLRECIVAVENEITYERKRDNLPAQTKGGQRQISDKGSALYNMALAVGNIISPILGGALSGIGDVNSIAAGNTFPNEAYDDCIEANKNNLVN
jgi:MFS family permease